MMRFIADNMRRAAPDGRVHHRVLDALDAAGDPAQSVCCWARSNRRAPAI